MILLLYSLFFLCDIIDLDLTLGKPNLHRCDSDAVYERYFSKLKCLLDRFFNLRHFLHFSISKYLRFQRQGGKLNNPLMGTETNTMHSMGRVIIWLAR